MIKYFDRIKDIYKRKLNENDSNKIENSYKILEKISFYEKILSRVLERIKLYYFSDLKKLIDIECFPLTPFDRLRQYFIEIISRSDYPLVDFEENIEEINTNRVKEFLHIILHEIEHKLKEENIDILNFKEYYNSYSFNTVIYLTLAPLSNFEPIIFHELSDMFVSILTIQFKRFYENEKNKKFQIDFKQFLIEESLKKKDFEIYNELRIFRRLHLHPEIKHTFFVDFYNLFCKAQVRILDLDKDFDFLIEIIRQVTLENFDREEEKVIFPNFRDILSKVIVEKTIPHTIAKKEAIKGFKSANYMIEFQNKLKEIIKTWEI